MSDYLSRLKEEEKDLKTKLGKLFDFTQSEKFKTVEQFEESIIQIQLEAMRTYYRCLAERIGDK